MVRIEPNFRFWSLSPVAHGIPAYRDTNTSLYGVPGHHFNGGFYIFTRLKCQLTKQLESNMTVRKIKMSLITVP